MKSSIKKYCDELIHEFNSISPERKKILEQISEYISSRKKQNKEINLIYICTHNSRRSHFGQIWAKVAAQYFNISHVNTFSGGTEVTAFNQNAINALLRIGFDIQKRSEDKNPIYDVTFDDVQEPCKCFSKVYNDITNPQKEFAAIMTCSDAEENCPFIPGVDLRIGTTYEDPKAFDNTPKQDSAYDERCRQIAKECLYVFSEVKKI